MLTLRLLAMPDERSMLHVLQHNSADAFREVLRVPDQRLPPICELHSLLGDFYFVAGDGKCRQCEKWRLGLVVEHAGCCAVYEGCNPSIGWFVLSVAMAVLAVAGLALLTVIVCLKKAEERRMKR